MHLSLLVIDVAPVSVRQRRAVAPSSLDALAARGIGAVGSRDGYQGTASGIHDRCALEADGAGGSQHRRDQQQGIDPLLPQRLPAHQPGAAMAALLRLAPGACGELRSGRCGRRSDGGGFAGNHGLALVELFGDPAGERLPSQGGRSPFAGLLCAHRQSRRGVLSSGGGALHRGRTAGGLRPAVAFPVPAGPHQAAAHAPCRPGGHVPFDPRTDDPHLTEPRF